MSELDRLSTPVLEEADSYRQIFVNALPFRQICIENFLEEEFAGRLLAEFPGFDRKLAINEGGAMGGKSVNTKIREIGPAYEGLYKFISSQPFLEFMSRLSGIPNLLLDPKMFGGGTHENRHGQELDPHIDFNYAEDHEQAYRPEAAGSDRVRILIDGTEVVNSMVEAGQSSVSASFVRGRDETFALEMLFEAQQTWSPVGDDRDLALMMIEMRMEHSEAGHAKKSGSRLFRW